MRCLHIICLTLCLTTTAWAEEESSSATSGLAARGPRPVEPGTRSECEEQKEWPLCTTDQWGPKCPSGCRMQGLINNADKEIAERIDKIRKFLAENQNNYKSASLVTRQTHDSLRNTLLGNEDSDRQYSQVVVNLQRRLSILHQRVTAQLDRIRKLRSLVQDQIYEMQRIEVDIDIKIRACKGSCFKSHLYNVDMSTYQAMETRLNDVSSLNLQEPKDMAVRRVLTISSIDSGRQSQYKTSTLTLDGEPLAMFGNISQTKMTLEVYDGTNEGMKITVDKETIGSRERFGNSTTVHKKFISCTRQVITKVTISSTGEETTVKEVVSSPGCEELNKLSHLDEVSSRTTVTSSSSSAGSEHDKLFSETDLQGGHKESSGSSSAKSSVSIFTGRGDSDFPAVQPPSHDFSNIKEFDDTSHFHDTRSSYSSKTVVETSNFKTDSRTLKTFEDVDTIQHDQSREDVPDFSARSLNKNNQRFRDYVGKDCGDILQKHDTGGKSGLYQIKPLGSEKAITVYCDQDTILGGWLLIQQRIDGSVNFNRTWAEYKKGFGNADDEGKGEMWLGNELIHLLTKEKTILRVELEDWAGNQAYAQYVMEMGPEADGYVLQVSTYVGDAGDALLKGVPDDDHYISHNNMKFSTFDKDNDKWEENCAEMYGGGWWYNKCQAANLNGIYYKGGQYDPRNNVPYEVENGVVWIPFKAADYSLNTVRMKIRPMHSF
ncbi:fibrinogen alpha chain [Latimeria chalumnae]|uniref:fibrinogen alpha chain n=1 Tax=Latimeria chalumnae TaxID=7897 RepID=UPI0003C14651|nr:PREDICTED: fibrinogen alpha chain [Latimeria chalumnae]|eukprot:XP_006010728.1 PREDICTED: fibrinogen alpha chain [Latimeria chalumnae]